MGSNRLDDCGRCDLLPTTTGWVRATQVRCPIHGSRPAALPADPTPPPVPADTLPEEWITAAAEAIEDVMIRRLGRDLGTIHRDEIVAAGLAAVVPLARAEGVAAGRTAAAAELPSGTAEILAWLERHGLSISPGVGPVLAAVRSDLTEGTKTDG
jgi:hypothetical protein